jgi:serine/threonine protein kinase
MCGTFVGTFKYMSPERMRSEKYSYASDMWSLGLVLMECATGLYPYVQDNSAIEMVQVSSCSTLVAVVAGCSCSSSAVSSSSSAVGSDRKHAVQATQQCASAVL